MCSLTNSAEAVAVIEQLFAAAHVEHVISIDDAYANEYPVEEALGLAGALDRTVTDHVFSNYPQAIGLEDTDLRNKQIRDVWDHIDRNERRRLTLSLQQSVVAEPPSPPERVDEATVTILPNVFGRYGLSLLSMANWVEHEKDIIKDEMPRTLILVDEDFSGENLSKNEGLRLVKQIVATTKPEKVLCALLSHNYGADGIHEKWKGLCAQEGLDNSRFVLIPKSFLTEDPIGFARLVKLAILNGSAKKLKVKATEILGRAEKEARDRLDAIDIYDFDQIVFRSSYREGVWEPDTLFRVFGLFHRDETRKLAREDAGVRNLVEEIRKISRIQTESESAPDSGAMELQRLELYEQAEYLNSHFTPVDIGDIFEKTVGSHKRFILLGQSCDLMVRSDGKRAWSSTDAVIAEIINDATAKGEEGYGHLPFLDSGKPDDFYVSFKQSCSIKLDALDLCAFQPNGEAKFTVGEPCPDAVIPAWKARHSKILSIVEHMLQRAKELNGKGISLKDAAGFVARCSNDKLFIPTLDLGLKTLTYNFKRVGRLRQPRAAALLSRYANFLARHAFDHDLGEQRQDAMTKPKDGIPAVVGNEVPLVAEALPRGEAIAITQELEREAQAPTETGQTEKVAEAKKDEEPPATI